MTRAALSACPVAAIRIDTVNRTTTTTSNVALDELIPSTTSTTTTKSDTIVHNNQTTHPVSLWSTDPDRSIIEQMTSKTLERPFPRPFLLDETKNTANHHHCNETSNAVPDVYWTGHHNEASFGAIPYLVKTWNYTHPHNNDDDNAYYWIMIDVPKFNHQSVRDITTLTGPNGPKYLFMTHVDDTADHELWAQYFNSTTSGYCQRIFHAGDLGPFNWIGDTSLEQVPILLSNPLRNDTELVAYTLDGTIISHKKSNPHWIEQFENGQLNTDVIILHTPGHSPGSCTLYLRRRVVPVVPYDSKDDHDISTTTTAATTPIKSSTILPGVLFTGDTYGYNGQSMTGFPRYGHDMNQLSHTLRQLVTQLHAWDVIAPGHALSRDYRHISSSSNLRRLELEQAQRDLMSANSH
jgi:glyoxylase-like metal-dependent hydrolase (beta-lactamase superfamily II)